MATYPIRPLAWPALPNKGRNAQPVSARELADILHRTHRMTIRESRAIVDELFNQIRLALRRGHRVSITNFGAFWIKNRAARSIINPHTGAPKKILAIKRAQFRVARKLRATL
jgi:integration host factor subunit alpha